MQRKFFASTSITKERRNQQYVLSQSFTRWSLRRSANSIKKCCVSSAGESDDLRILVEEDVRSSTQLNFRVLDIIYRTAYPNKENAV
ncbi:hypothetical protein TNCV_2995961 [Trichonephila clavipes]|nr:hypothetical protein TNCV_2995961 [Trichonephila clavipes]